MKIVFNLLAVFSVVLFLAGCGGGKSESGSNGSASSSLTSPYKYFVYVANYTDNTISSFSMSRDTGVMTLIETTSAGENGHPTTLAVSPSGDKLYVGKTFADTSPNFKIFNINKTNGALIPFQGIKILNTAILGNTTESISKVSASKDGRFVFVFSFEGAVTTYTVSSLTGTLMLSKAISLSTTTTSLIHPNDELLLWGNSTGITFWPIDKSNGQIVQSSGASTASTMTQPISIAVTPDGSRMFSSGYGQGSGVINSYNLDLVNRSSTNIEMVSVGGMVGEVAISNFGKVLLVTDPNKNILYSYIINLTTGILKQIDSKVVGVYPHKVSFFPDGKYALVLSKTNKTLSTVEVEESSGSLKLNGSISTGNEPQDMLILRIP